MLLKKTESFGNLKRSFDLKNKKSLLFLKRMSFEDFITNWDSVGICKFI